VADGETRASLLSSTQSLPAVGNGAIRHVAPRQWVHTPGPSVMSEAEATNREPKVIKRYTNRKLYDTVESRYVTLDEVADMVKEGVEVQIIDNRTKEDLTSVTLAQIVFEEEKKKNQMPLSVLRIATDASARS
jgi:polyhydroxyalkanoate synthesis repressor PhaR